MKSVQKAFLQNFLKNKITKDVIRELQQYDGDFIPERELKSFGLTFDYLPDQLLVRLNIQPEIRKSLDVDLAFNNIPRWAKGALYSEGVSGFVNLFNFYRDSSNLENDQLTSDQNWNFNYGRWALFGQTSWQRDGDSRFIRQDVRLTYDRPDELIRFQLGDINYNVQDFQTFQPGAGFLFSTNFDLNPYRLFNPMTFREITLNTPSRVRVFVNGVLVQTLNLPQGRHRLDNLPLNEGINTIRLEIQDNRGRLENIQFNGTTSYNLVSKGIHDMTYGGGLPAVDALEDRRYDTDDKKYFYVLNHLYGFSDQYNAGYGLMGNSNQRLLSFRHLYQGQFGFSNLNISASQLMRPSLGSEGYGVGGRFTHVFRDYQNEERRLRNFDFGLEYLGPKFVAMDDLAPNSFSQLTPELGYTQFITDAVNVRLRGQYRFYSTPSQEDFYNLSSALTLLYKRYYQFGLQYSFSKFEGGASDNQLLLSFNWSLPQSGQVVTTSFNTETSESNAQWNYTGRGRPGNWRGLTNLRKNPSQTSVEAEIGREDQRYAATVNYLQQERDLQSTTRNTTINFNTALAFAGGEVSISRPINQGFALVKTKGALERHSLMINRNNEDFEAETGLLNSAVLPNFQAYRYYPVRIDSRNLPFGIKAPPQELVVAPPFRGGVLVSLFAKSTKALSGKVFWKGAGLALKVGEVKAKDGKESYPFFTNRKGRFLIEAIEPGSYEVWIEEKSIGELEVQEDGSEIQYWEYKK